MAKFFGKGDPILLITGANGVRMDVWDPVLLRELASSHTVIIFDNRGSAIQLQDLNYFQSNSLSMTQVVC